MAGKDAILVVCDKLSKMTHFIATMEEMTVEGLARLFKDNIWRLYGLPESVVLDRGPQFTTELTRELNKMLGIQTKLSTAFHPQTDVLRTKEVNLIFSYFLFLFLFYFQFIFLYSIFRTRVRVRVTRSRCHTAGHIRWHSHKSHNT